MRDGDHNRNRLKKKRGKSVAAVVTGVTRSGLLAHRTPFRASIPSWQLDGNKA
jgi:hypothetical protein